MKQLQTLAGEPELFRDDAGVLCWADRSPVTGNTGPLIRRDLEGIVSALERERAAERRCECDNTHEQNDTVCRPCWARGYRTWRSRWGTAPEPRDHTRRLDEPEDGIDYDSTPPSADGARR